MTFLKLLLSYHDREFLGLTVTCREFDLSSPSQVVKGSPSLLQTKGVKHCSVAFLPLQPGN